MAMAAMGKWSPLSLAKGGARTACEMVKGIFFQTMSLELI